MCAFEMVFPCYLGLGLDPPTLPVKGWLRTIIACKIKITVVRVPSSTGNQGKIKKSLPSQGNYIRKYQIYYTFCENYKKRGVSVHIFLQNWLHIEKRSQSLVNIGENGNSLVILWKF